MFGNRWNCSAQKSFKNEENFKTELQSKIFFYLKRTGQMLKIQRKSKIWRNCYHECEKILISNTSKIKTKRFSTPKKVQPPPDMRTHSLPFFIFFHTICQTPFFIFFYTIWPTPFLLRGGNSFFFRKQSPTPHAATSTSTNTSDRDVAISPRFWQRSPGRFRIPFLQNTIPKLKFKEKLTSSCEENSQKIQQKLKFKSKIFQKSESWKK